MVHDYRCISRKMPEHCDCETWCMLDAQTCLPGPAGHCGCFFFTPGAPKPGTCCICDAVNLFSPEATAQPGEPR